MKKIKLYVMTSPNTIRLLKYIDKNIEVLNQGGILVRIERIRKHEMDDTLVSLLNKAGINRLPAARDEQGKCYIGVKNIVEMLRGQIKYTQHVQKISTSSGDPLADFWNEGMYDRDEKGLRQPRSDNDDGMNGPPPTLPMNGRGPPVEKDESFENSMQNLNERRSTGGNNNRPQGAMHMGNDDNITVDESNMDDDDRLVNQMLGIN